MFGWGCRLKIRGDVGFVQFGSPRGIGVWQQIGRQSSQTGTSARPTVHAKKTRRDRAKLTSIRHATPLRFLVAALARIRTNRLPTKLWRVRLRSDRRGITLNAVVRCTDCSSIPLQPWAPLMSTVVIASLFLGLLITHVLLWALFLGIGLRWARVPNVTTTRILVTTALVFASEIAARASVMWSLWMELPDPVLLLLVLGYLVVTVVLPFVVVASLFKTSLLRTAQAWLPTIAASAITLTFIFFVLRPYFVEAFKISANSMAPTLLGKHWRGTCPVCGNPAYCSPVPVEYAVRKPPLMICQGNFHVNSVVANDVEVFAGDRILAAKFLHPRRWDLVVFRYPEEPSVNYVLRLVGLPGETITIREGCVWANGKQLTPPESADGINYVSDLGPYYPKPWGAADNPAELADDEYFVLGDFSHQAKDSRLWERGADGHSPFAVPASYITGVVSHVYWPFSRCRIVR